MVLQRDPELNAWRMFAVSSIELGADTVFGRVQHVNSR